MGCIRPARFNMRATLLRASVGVEANDDDNWHWESTQDPDSGAVIRVRVKDDPNTDEDESERGVQEIDVMARGVIDGGIRVAGTTETFDQVYRATDWVKITFAANIKVSARDQITNIRSKDGGPVIWLEEGGLGGPTVFNVKGVTPVVEIFGGHVENFALLERAEINN